MEDRAGLPSKRELIAQLIDVRRREVLKETELRQLKIDNAKLKAENERLRDVTRNNNGTELRQQLRHAQRELAEKKQRPMLSNEEWAVVREMRRQCD